MTPLTEVKLYLIVRLCSSYQHLEHTLRIELKLTTNCDCIKDKHLKVTISIKSCTALYKNVGILFYSYYNRGT